MKRVALFPIGLSMYMLAYVPVCVLRWLESLGYLATASMWVLYLTKLSSTFSLKSLENLPSPHLALLEKHVR